MDAPPHLLILGTAQDGGVPQAGCAGPCCETAWRNPERRRRVSCAALVAPGDGLAWMIDATPDFREQLHALTGARLGGIFLTHGHIGHYLGLAQLGKEAMAARNLPVFAMPGMETLLRTSEPWRQLVRLDTSSRGP
jgi:pyrroloquinoline quinone biosynthesis protein B